MQSSQENKTHRVVKENGNIKIYKKCRNHKDTILYEIVKIEEGEYVLVGEDGYNCYMAEELIANIEQGGNIVIRNEHFQEIVRIAQ